MKKRTLISGAVAITAAGAITLAGTVVAQAQETGDEALGAALDAILADARLTDSQAGVVVADAATGEVLYERNPDKRAIPGSNDKLFTTAAALEALGGDYTYATDVIGEPPVDGVVSGDLYLRGTGDPTTLEADYDRLAADLAAAGVTTVDGDLVADDTAFDDVRSGAEWGWSDLQFTYAAEVTALNIASGDDHQAGSVRLFVKPGAAAGDPAVVTTVPQTDYLDIVSTATTGTSTSVNVNRDPHDNTVRISGTVAAGGSGTYATRAVIEPTQLVADVFADSLAEAGIDLTGDLRYGEPTPRPRATSSPPTPPRPCPTSSSTSSSPPTPPWPKPSSRPSATKRPARAPSRPARPPSTPPSTGTASTTAPSASPTAPGSPATTCSPPGPSPTSSSAPKTPPGSTPGTTPSPSPARTAPSPAACAAPPPQATSAPRPAP
nr:hypothetical protein GCM10025732_10620 [Glycomyces mayteni]